MDKIMNYEIQKLCPKYERRQLYFQAKQEKLDEIKFKAEIKSKARFADLLYLISTGKNFQHCHKTGPLKLEDFASLQCSHGIEEPFLQKD